MSNCQQLPFVVINDGKGFWRTKLARLLFLQYLYRHKISTLDCICLKINLLAILSILYQVLKFI